MHSPHSCPSTHPPNEGRPLIWIGGPPGAGKTTLAASYLETRASPGLWYQIDAGDSDPAAFFQYLVAAAEGLQQEALASVPKFVPEHWSSIADFARLFFRALFAQLAEGTVLVLDNYQELEEQSAVHEALRQAIREVPPNSSVIVVSRKEPPASLVEFSANGAMLFIGWDQLQLSLEEVGAICAQRNVTDAWLLNALHRESQGWAAGITLMLERLTNLGRSHRELPHETRESVFDYFASLIFGQAPESTRHVLLSTAFLPRVTVAFAQALSGSSEAGTVLEELYRRRLFTDRRPGVEYVYQFHALFTDFLRARARSALSGEALQQLLDRTALVLESAEDCDGAVEVWREGGNWQQLRRLVLGRAQGLLDQGRRQTLTQHLLAIPEGVRARDPWLVYWLGRARLQVAPQDGMETLREALVLFQEGSDQAGQIECLTALLGGAFLGFHALDAMDPWLDQLLNQLDAVPGLLSADAELRVTGILCLTLFHVRPWHPAVSSTYQRIEELLPRCSNASVALLAVMAALVVSSLCGDFERGDRLARAIEPLALAEPASPSDAAWAYAQVVWLRFIEGRYEAALECIAKTLAMAESNGLRQLDRQLLLWRFTVEWRAVGGRQPSHRSQRRRQSTFPLRPWRNRSSGCGELASPGIGIARTKRRAWPCSASARPCRLARAWRGVRGARQRPVRRGRRSPRLVPGCIPSRG